ncbi:glycosyltransferase family 4 protein [Frigoriflavimonas asaccharolytica]|uniref:Glycosyltransferase involved in cell wall biosynthesis n=1 Tax=Frigoriflavimonas asaccharolytica TaxID=2735899 RepID=A0A8J8K803_9FLAO|nr:glycosyltransferase family 1 protein [Frigoriflavimonas asaccharolytica]NRS91472.1 glycosyltransferase involved in cell wall biosynthesis [Frigoriflavimonas asaccharolytica]
MKIGFDAKRFFNNSSGLGNYSRDLVRILATYFPENQSILFNNNLSEKGKKILEFPNVSFVETTKGNFSRQLKMGKDAQNSGCDIFHGLSGELPLKWNEKPIKKVVTIHDLIFMRFPKYYSFLDRKIHFWKFKKACENADLIIAISLQTKRDIIQYLKIPEDKIRIVYQGCHSVFKENQDAQFLNLIKEKYNLPERFILNVGTIEERKNLLNIVKAIDKTEIPLVVIGRKTKYFKKVQKFINKNSLQTQVQFLENVSMEELAAIYKLAEIFVYPSFFEGFGIPIIEAHFSNTVVITSNLSCLPEAGGEDSMYVNPNDYLDIKSKIEFLWNNEAERKRRAENSLNFVQKFNDEIIGKNLMSVYQELIF